MRIVVIATILVLSVISNAGRQIDAQQFSLPTKTRTNSYSFIVERIEQSKKVLGLRIDVLLRLSDSLEQKLLQIQEETETDMTYPLYKIYTAKQLLNKSKIDLQNISVLGGIESIDDVKNNVSVFREDLREIINNINIAKSILREAALEAKESLE